MLCAYHLPLAIHGRSGTGQEVILNVVSSCNVFGSYLDPVDELIACRTDR